MTKRIAGALLLGALVVGCGGGSDAPADARASGAAAQGTTLSEASMALAAGQAGATASAVQAILDAQRALFEQGVLSAAIADILKQEAGILETLRLPDPATGVPDPAKVKEADDLAKARTQLVFSIGRSCTGGGSLSLTWNDLDRSKNASGGDVIQLLTSDCVWNTGAAAVSGGLTVNVTRLQADAAGQAEAGALRIGLAGLRVGTRSVSGSVAVEFDAAQQSLSTSDLSAQERVTLVTSYQLQANADRASGQLSLQGRMLAPLPDPVLPQGATNTWLPQSLSLNTDAPLRFENGHPVDGGLRLVAEPGDGSAGTVRFTAEGFGGQLLGANGASTFSTPITPW